MSGTNPSNGVPRPRFRKLRIAWSVGWGIACVMLVGLWMRSYLVIDGLSFPLTSRLCLNLGSMPGCAGAGIAPKSGLLPNQPLPSWNSGSTEEWLNIPIEAKHCQPSRVWGIFFADSEGFLIPYWFVTIFAGLFALVPWLRWSKRFSLRTLLIATTLVAVGLGLIVWLR
jgi:hypothetical protein